MSVNSSASAIEAVPTSSPTRLKAASTDMPDSTQIRSRSSASGQADWIEAWRLPVWFDRTCGQLRRHRALAAAAEFRREGAQVVLLARIEARAGDEDVEGLGRPGELDRVQFASRTDRSTR